MKMTTMKKPNRSEINAREIELEKMDTETATIPSYSGVAFRLPALPRDTSRDAKDKDTRDRNGCPRELRVAAASENSIMEKQKRFMLQKSRSLVKRKREEDEVEDKIKLPRDATSELPDLGITSTAWMDAADAMGYLVRELTEFTEAIERSKSRIRRDTLKGLRKLIAGVLHTMRQDQLRAVLDPLSISGKKYENITQAVALSPRIVRKAEKREPSRREIHLCRGCRQGGFLPWLYLYPDHEVYRTGGGYDCCEFHLPIVRSDKSLTIPRDPFGNYRGRLTDTSPHRLPDKMGFVETSTDPFAFERRKGSRDTRLSIPSQEMRSLSSGIDTGKGTFDDPADLRNFDPVYSSSEQSLFTHYGTYEMKSSTETLFFDGNRESDVYPAKRRSIASQYFENDSGVVTEISSGSEISLPQDDISRTKIQQDLAKLNHLRKKVTGFEPIEFRSAKNREEEEMVSPRLSKKLVIRTPMITGSNSKDGSLVHHSSLLFDENSLDSKRKDSFGARKRSSLKPIGFDAKNLRENRRKVSTGEGTDWRSRKTSTTISDMSVNFSSTLSLGTFDDEFIEDESSELTLTGSKVKPATRRISHEVRERKVSKTSIKKKVNSRKRSTQFSKEKLDEQALDLKDAEKSKPKKGKSKKQSVVLHEKIKTEVSEVNKDSDDVILNEQNEDADENDFDISSVVTSGKLSPTTSLGGTSIVRVEEESFDSIESFFDDIQDLDVTDEMDDKLTDLFDLSRIEEEEGSIESDDIQGLLSSSDTDSEKRRRKRNGKRRRTLQFRMEPLSTYTLQRREKKGVSTVMDELDEDLSMLDYAARYCIISLERLSKYETIFSSFASCGGEGGELHHLEQNEVSTNVVGKTEQQRKLLKDYEKLVYSMDVYQQKISEAERKRNDLIRERERSLTMFKVTNLDQEEKELLEKSIQAFSTRIATVEGRVKEFVGNVKKLMAKKQEIEDGLRSSQMDNEAVDKLIKNSDFLGRKFTKLKCLQIKVEDLPDALKTLNRNFDDEDFKFVNHVLKLPQKDSLDFKAFSVVAALSERVKSLDKSIKSLLKEVDLATLERKLDKCKELYRLLSEEHHDGKRTVPLENLLVELQAGGLERDHQRSVIDKLNHHGLGFVDFLDFVLYVPLFLMIHDHIVQKPFE